VVQNMHIPTSYTIAQATGPLERNGKRTTLAQAA